MAEYDTEVDKMIRFKDKAARDRDASRFTGKMLVAKVRQMDVMLTEPQLSLIRQGRLKPTHMQAQAICKVLEVDSIA